MLQDVNSAEGHFDTQVNLYVNSKVFELLRLQMTTIFTPASTFVTKATTANTTNAGTIKE